MPFPRPTLAALRARVRSLLQNIPGADTALRRSVLGVIADTVAGLSNLELGYGDWLAGNLLPDTANAEYLARWATIYNLPQEGASFAAGLVAFNVTAAVSITAGTVLERQADGWQYVLQATVTSSGTGTLTASVEAATPGLAGNAAGGGALSLTVAIAGVSGQVAIGSDGLTGGADIEAPESWRARILARIRQPPQGGIANDYVEWATAVSGVTRAWALPLNRGIGTVDLTFIMDGRTNIVPLSADVIAVQAAIDAKRPVTANCQVFAPTAYPLNLTITGLVVTPGSTLATVKAAIAAELTDMLVRRAVPAGTIRLSWIEGAITTAAGEDHFILTSPSADVPVSAGNLATLGTITYA